MALTLAPATRALVALGSALMVSFDLGAAVAARDARIVEVTLFRDRAEVIREARVDLPAGAGAVEFLGIPFGVEPDSFRVTALGTPVVLGAAEIRERADEPVETPEWIAARDEVERIRGKIARVDQESKDAASLRAFLNSIQTAAGPKGAEGEGPSTLDPTAIQGVYDLLRKNLSTLGVEGLDREDARRKLTKELELAEARLHAARPAGAIRSRAVVVEVDAARAGSLTLRLAYVVPNASWRPAYRASLDAASGEIALVSEAVVRQSTGEDWSDVALRLSTAAPARGVLPPRLEPWLLRPWEGGAYDNAMGKELSRLRELAGAPAPPPAARAEADRIDAPAEAEIREAGVVRSAYSVTFEVPGRSAVPADGSDHRVVLRQETLAAEVGYRVVPALNPVAFLTAKTTAPSGYPLLAGPARVFAGGAYLGSFALPETAPKAELILPFGVDNQVEVERIDEPQARTREGLGGKDRQVARSFRTSVENLHDRPVTVVVEDRLPVSEDERIEVERGRGTTAGFREDPERAGVLEWTLELAPAQRREVVLEYSVRFPRDLVVPGLD